MFSATTGYGRAKENGMQKRKFGKTGAELSVTGFGGMLLMHEPKKSAERLVSFAVDSGVNYFDVAPTYGNAEEVLASALLPYRKNVFLACKSVERSGAGVRKELERSLKRFKTDRLDLYQLHAVNTEEDIESVFSKNGPLETLIKAKESGLIKFIGFSSHNEETALALIEKYDFDSLMFPLNIFCWYKVSFGKRIVAAAAKKGMGINALKTLCKSAKTPGEAVKWEKCWYLPLDEQEDVDAAVRFTLNLPVTSALSSSHEELFKMQLKAAEKPKPLAEKEIRDLLAKYGDTAPLFGG